MALKQSNNGQFTIPASPSAGTAVAQSASANTYGSYVQLIASTTEADYILGIRFEATTTQVPTYLSIAIGTGGAGSETLVCTVDCPITYTTGATSTQIGGFVQLRFSVAVATSTRVAVKTASSVASAVSWNISLTVMKQADLVDAGIKEQVDVQTWLGGTIPTPVVTGVPQADTQYVNGNSTAADVLALLYSSFENGTAQAGGTNTLTLRSGASTVDKFYNDQVAVLTGGTGAVQTNRIMTYVGSTKVATMETNWAMQPDATSTYVILGRVG